MKNTYSSIHKSLKIARIATVPEAFVHIKYFIKYISSKNVKIFLVSSAGSYEKIIKNELGIETTHVEIKRKISPLSDIMSILSLIKIFKKYDFDIVHSSTPKAGFLVALAGVFFPSTIRIHTFTGQRWATLTGVYRFVLKTIDKVIIRLNTQCYADSASQIRFLVNQGVIQNEASIRLLHKGSYGGVDISRFDKTKYLNARSDVLKTTNFPADAFIVLYMGRLTHDKGVDNLVKAFALASEKNKKLKLVLAGHIEPELDPLEAETMQQINNNPNIYRFEFQSHPELLYSAADVFCMPSYREGFGTVIIEAAACGLPAIVTDIPGLQDAVVDNETGIIVPLNNAEILASTILKISEDPKLCHALGNAAKLRAVRDFNSELLAEIQWQEYDQLLKARL